MKLFKYFRWGEDYLSALNISFLISFYFFVYFGLNIYIGVTVYIPLGLILLYRLLPSGVKEIKFTFLDISVALYILINTLSGIFVLTGELDGLAYLKSMPYVVFPIVFYFYFSLFHLDEGVISRFLNVFIFWSLFIVIFGFYYQIFPSEEYITYLTELNGPDYLAYATFIPRMFSYLNSSVVGAVSAISVPILFHVFKNRLGFLFTLLFTILAVGCFLSIARASWLVFLVVTCICVIRYRAFRFFPVLLLIAVSFYAFIDVGERAVYFEIFASKIDSGLGGAIVDRQDMYASANQYILNNPAGSGLGSVGHKSVNVLDLGVTDANFHRIFAEVGWLGGSIFLMIIINLYYKCYKLGFKDDFSFTAFCVFGAFVLIGIGTNIFDYNYSSNMFWAFAGLVSWKMKRMELSKSRQKLTGAALARRTVAR